MKNKTSIDTFTIFHGNDYCESGNAITKGVKQHENIKTKIIKKSQDLSIKFSG